ncbi:MAG: lysylphosphatidylglycerol synthase transmembrane domain-containing protein [Candidatus Omnitrophica bacterium]|nr:lysylphosphatidylglycerol synthase transmembrane domain-containing protein [Candidatus Omnitrophota bacterium]
MQVIKKILTLIFRFGISIILIFFLFEKVDKKSLFELIKNADKGLLFLAFFVFFSGYYFCLLRWQMLLKAVNIHLPLKRIIISFSGGVFFSLFLPSTIGGDLMRSIDLSKHTKRPGEVIATVFLDRLSGYIGLVILAFVALILGWRFVEDVSVLSSMAIITVVLFALLILFFNKALFAKISKLLHTPDSGKIRELIKNMHKEIHYFRHNKKIILKNLSLSVLIQVTSPLTFYITALSLGVKIKLIYFLIYLPIISAITLLPISIGGLGLRDASTIYFFAKAGVSRDLAFAMSLLNFSFILICGLMGGIIYVLTVRHRRLQYHKPSAISSL